MGTKDRDKGLYGKFNVSRVDGRDAPGGDKAGAYYYVLDLTHDPFARVALAAYAHACEGDFPLLAADLRRYLAVWQENHGTFKVPGYHEIEPGRFIPNALEEPSDGTTEDGST